MYHKRSKKRRRNIPRSDVNYANAANGGQLQELNDIRQLTAIDKRLEEKHLKYLVPKIIELAKKEYREDEIKAARKKADSHLIRKPNFDGQENLRNIVRADRSYSSSQTSRWLSLINSESSASVNLLFLGSPFFGRLIDNTGFGIG